MALSMDHRLMIPVESGLPAPPAGFAYLIDSDGNYVVDSDGNYILVEVS